MRRLDQPEHQPQTMRAPYEELRAQAREEAWRQATEILAYEAPELPIEHPSTRVESFLEATHAQQTHPVLFALWAETMQSLCVQKTPGKSPLSMNMPRDLYTPTASIADLRIPIASQEEAISLLYLPDITPLNHEPYELAATRSSVPGFEFGHTRVYTLALNQLGTDLVALINTPHDGLDALDAVSQQAITSPEFQEFKINMIHLLRNFRQRGYSQHSVVDLPGASYALATT